MIARLTSFLIVCLCPFLASAEDVKPKLGPDAVPIFAAPGYFRTAPAPDYWRLAAFYVPQDTSSACSVASVAMAVNFIRGLPPSAEDRLVTPAGLLEAVADEGWTAKTVEEGDGVTFQDLVDVLTESLAAYELANTRIETYKPADASPASLGKVRELLAANEASAQDMLLVYFNQGVLTGDWDGPHISPIGAYDAANDRVLVMDVDREWYVPYWVPAAKLLEAMLKPAGPDQGPLAGETGGFVKVTARGS